MDRSKLLEKNKKHTHKSPNLKVYYVPFGLRSHGRHHKHKKDKYYVHHEYKETSDKHSAMMSGDSPNAQKHELFEFKEDRKPPSPTTSRDAAVQIENANANNTDLAAASAFSDKVNEEVSKEPYSNETNEAHKNEDEILATAEEVPLRTEKRQSADGNYISRNENLNRLDGITIKPVNKKEEPEEDESCGIKCLYYTLQCCECTIM